MNYSQQSQSHHDEYGYGTYVNRPLESPVKKDHKPLRRFMFWAGGFITVLSASILDPYVFVRGGK